MKKIPRLFTNTRVSETNGVMSLIIEEYNKKDYSSDIFFTNILSKLITTNNELGTAIKRDVVESELADLDDITDTLFTQLHGLTKGYTYHPDTHVANAAEQLFKMLDKYGLEVKNKSYREEYPLLGSLIKDSKTESYQAYIAQLSGTDVRFAQLETAINNFNTRKIEYHGMKDIQKEMESATTIKKRLIELFNEDVGPHLYVMAKANPDLYGELASFVANRIEESNAAVRNRKKKE